jgi:hypothetical protein
MGRRQSKGDFHGGGTLVRQGDRGFTPLAPDLGQPNSSEVPTPLMAKARIKSEVLLAKKRARLAKKPARRRMVKEWINETSPKKGL